MLDFDDIKVEFESQGFRCSRVGISPERDKAVMFMESMANTESVICPFCQQSARMIENVHVTLRDELTDYQQAIDGWTKWFEAAKESAIPALVKFAMQKEARLPGLAAHAIFRISTGKLEGFNNKIKVAKRIGYGYASSSSSSE